MDRMSAEMGPTCSIVGRPAGAAAGGAAISPIEASIPTVRTAESSQPTGPDGLIEGLLFQPSHCFPGRRFDGNGASGHKPEAGCLPAGLPGRELRKKLHLRE